MDDFTIYLNDRLENDPEFRAEYEALAPEFELEKALYELEVKTGFTREQIAAFITEKAKVPVSA
ncbi:hypothetical protein FACS18949_07660 [Clostridia bacterium]|nr:hypothetical protein FACS18949_07660 [Clostridia bacterium]